MGDLSTLEVIIIAIVEGLTEFLPVSSTGHMIITQNILGVPSELYSGSGRYFRAETLPA